MDKKLFHVRVFQFCFSCHSFKATEAMTKRAIFNDKSRPDICIFTFFFHHRAPLQPTMPFFQLCFRCNCKRVHIAFWYCALAEWRRNNYYRVTTFLRHFLLDAKLLTARIQRTKRQLIFHENTSRLSAFMNTASFEILLWQLANNNEKYSSLHEI